MSEKPQKIVTVDQLPDDPFKMPPPYWRGCGAIFHLEHSLRNIEELLKEFLPIHTETEARLEKHFDKYSDDEASESEKAMDEFSEITDELSEFELRIQWNGEAACLMSAIESEDDINRFCVFNLHKDISESIERLAAPEKLLVAAASVGKSGTKQTSAFRSLCELVSWRNAFAHGHCVDRQTKTLRHNHLIQPDDYPGVPSVLAETQRLVGAFLRLSDYLHSISLNPYTKEKEGNVENVREALRRIACYRFDGDNWAYEVMLTGSEQENVVRALQSLLKTNDKTKKAKLKRMLTRVKGVRAKILDVEFGISSDKPGGRQEAIKATKLSAREFEKQRAIALTNLFGVVELMPQEDD